MSKAHPSTSLRWTTEDVTKVLSLKAAGESFKAIGKLLGRTPAACSTKYYEVKRELPWLFDQHTQPEPEPVQEYRLNTDMLTGAGLFAGGVLVGLYISWILIL